MRQSPDRWIVITTINPPTRTIELIAELCARGEWAAVVVGDRKTPSDWSAPPLHFLDLDQQRELFGSFSDEIPMNHYSRKNLGYLYAMRQGASMILETDDDNEPYASFGTGCELEVSPPARWLIGDDWVNIYEHFKRPEDEKVLIWPRGLPLDALFEAGTLRELAAPRACPIQQYLADNDPDVDAIYRLTNRKPLSFSAVARPVVVDRGTWVPFNAQNTLYFPVSYPLLYLPCEVTFRMTDIWRSFVAHAALTHHGYATSFHAATVLQNRNQHDLMRDFADETVGYLNNRRIGQLLIETLNGLPSESVGLTARALWMTLAQHGFVTDREIERFDGWLAHVAVLDPGGLPEEARDTDYGRKH